MIVILFTINSKCYIPLHTLVTDVVVTCGGQLVKLCKKSNSQCGPGCTCIGYKNLPVEAVGPSADQHSDSAVISDDSERLEHEVDQLMADVFGTTGSSDENMLSILTYNIEQQMLIL